MRKRTPEPAPAQRKPRIYMTDPVVPLRWRVDPGSDIGLDVWPCFECFPWHVDIETVHGVAVVTEWHAIECPAVDRWCDDDGC